MLLKIFAKITKEQKASASTKFFQTFKEEISAISLKLSQRMRGDPFQINFYKTNKTLILKHEDITRKENYTPISIVSIVAKTRTKY